VRDIGAALDMVHRGRRHSRDAFQRALHIASAAAAGHPADGKRRRGFAHVRRESGALIRVPPAVIRNGRLPYR